MPAHCDDDLMNCCRDARLRTVMKSSELQLLPSDPSHFYVATNTVGGAAGGRAAHAWCTLRPNHTARLSEKAVLPITFRDTTSDWLSRVFDLQASRFCVSPVLNVCRLASDARHIQRVKRREAGALQFACSNNFAPCLLASPCTVLSPLQGCVLHGVRYGGRAPPRALRPDDESQLSVTCLDFSPFPPNLLLVSNFRLYSTSGGGVAREEGPVAIRLWRTRLKTVLQKIATQGMAHGARSPAAACNASLSSEHCVANDGNPHPGEPEICRTATVAQQFSVLLG